jgi:hypothetical protein
MLRSGRKVLAGLASLGLLLGWSVPAAVAQPGETIATLSRPASVPVRTQAGASSDRVLQLWIRSYTPPRRGAVEVAVSLARDGREVEVGRFAVFPSEPFVARTPARERGYAFDASAALAALAGAAGELTSRVRLLPIEPGQAPEGASLTVSRAELVSR